MSSNSIYHVHHIVPKHMGGTDDPSNLIKLTIEEHAEAHRVLYEQHGWHQDHVAHRMLLGQISKAEAIKEMQKKPKSIAWKKKMSERMMGKDNPMYGKTHTQEWKDAKAIETSKRMKGVPKWYKCNNPVMYGKDNPRSRPIMAEGVRYDCIADAIKAHGFKNSNSVHYRLRHATKFNDWYYV